MDFQEILRSEPGPEFDTKLAVFMEKACNTGTLRFIGGVSLSHNSLVLTFLIGFGRFKFLSMLKALRKQRSESQLEGGLETLYQGTIFLPLSLDQLNPDCIAMTEAYKDYPSDKELDEYMSWEREVEKSAAKHFHLVEEPHPDDRLEFAHR